MRITVEFDSLEDFYRFQNSSPRPVTPPVDNAHVAPGAEQFSEPAPAKRKRRTNAEIAADVATAQSTAAKPSVVETTTAQTSEFEDEPAAQTQASDFLEYDDAPPAKEVTKDDVRAALVAYQERLTKAGKDLEKARETVLDVIEKVVGKGVRKLGAVTPDKFAALVAAAQAAK